MSTTFMTADELLKPTPWDSAIYGIETYEIPDATREALSLAASRPGHYTVKVDPLASTRLLHDHGFYYCDTLIEPHCASREFTLRASAPFAISRDVSLEALAPICHGAFSYDRFHRDFNLDPRLADRRYDNWLRTLHAAGEVFGLLHERKLAGFIALTGNRMVLHALGEEFRGRGMAKEFWTAACRHFFDELALPELESSISVGNLPVVNLYASLGFRFRNCRSVYHLLVR